MPDWVWLEACDDETKRPRIEFCSRRGDGIAVTSGFDFGDATFDAGDSTDFRIGVGRFVVVVGVVRDRNNVDSRCGVAENMS